MNDKIDREIEKTIELLRASMPAPKSRRTSFFSLIRVAASEINLIQLIVILMVTLILGAVLSKALPSPMLTCFSTAPMPLLLLFHYYICRSSDEMRELEQTFKYSYAEMLSARVVLISAYMLVCLTSLAAVIRQTVGIEWLRLAFCGAVPSILICASLLWISNRVHSGNIALTALVIWVFLCFFALLLPLETQLQAIGTAVYGLLIVPGVGLNWLCLRQINERGFGYANVTR